MRGLIKSKQGYFITIFFLLFFCFSMYEYSSQIKKERIHQHLKEEWQRKEGTGETGFYSNLPIIQIETNGQKIPGNMLLDSHGKQVGFETAEDGSESIIVRFSITDLKQGNNTLEDEPTISTYAQVRVRGNSSRLFDKKSYAVKLVNEAGKDNPQELAGMSRYDEWVLNGPFLDRTLVRNYLCYNIAGEIMEYAPNVRYCEVFINGEYKGLYLLIETISRSNGKINITKSEKNNMVTSYIVRWDRAGKGDHELNSYTYYTYRADVSALDVRYPGNKLITDQKLSFINQDISKIEKILYSYDMIDDKKGYTQYLDIQSFAEYFIINEFFRNVDAGRFSTFYYKDVRGKLKTCVWDFNNACDNYIDYLWDESGFSMINAPWFSQLIKDKKFVDMVVTRYAQLRKSVLSDEYLQNYIDETVLWLGDAIDRNYKVWGYVFDKNFYNGLNYLTPVERNYESYEEALTQLKDFIKRRGSWLDEHISTLYQYCHESKNVNEFMR